MAVQERTDLLTFLETLTPEQWESPSLCAGWSVRRVVAHVISYDELSWFGVFKRAVRGGFRPDRINELGVADYAELGAERLLAVLRANLRPTGPITALGGQIPLVDGTIHHQDIRRPLGMPRQIPAERLRVVLDLALKAPPTGAKKRAEGLTARATDLDWTHGEGPEVTGPGEALLLALAGRKEALGDLDGRGMPMLTERL
ncbi:maleylpyruvate isomerase family mycothiol-dependent enzyme [Saccharopolyspora halophila]|uniref:Maleylpyruvate isomerase family mycothiol-dependent enzyme n=2 Tax=Saccharopolyspora halophila TaxID=405551 RepID=A0ABP5T8H5_9PSEU